LMLATILASTVPGGDDPALITFAAIPSWMFLEAASLSRFGTTPGKYVLNIWVWGPGERKLQYVEALNRSASVWFRGIAMGFWLVSLFTMWVSFQRLTKSGYTAWDAKGPWLVEHRRLGANLPFLCRSRSTTTSSGASSGDRSGRGGV